MVANACRWPEGGYLIANGIKQHYLRWGDEGPSLLLIPGITSPAITWNFVAERLSEFAQVYVLDVRGRGLSENRPGLSYSLDACARDALGVIEGLGLDRPIVLGHSMGGRIAAALGALAPEAPERLIIVDPPMTGPGRRPYPSPLQWYLEALREVTAGGGMEAVRKQLPDWTDEQIALRAEWLPTCTEEAIAGSYRSFNEEDMHAFLPGIRRPTLLMYAEKGGTVTEEDAREFVDLLPDGRSVRIDGAGHMIPWDRLDAFIDEVRKFAL